MKILTWNILASEWIKKSYYPRINKSTLFNRKKRFQVICEWILMNNADVIMLQEVMKEEYKKLKILLSNKYSVSSLKLMYWSYSVGDSNSGNVTILNPIIFKDIIHIAFPFALFTECKYKGKLVNIINVHLDDISAATRKEQLETALSNTTSAYVIIAGDFNHNYTPSSPFYKLSGYKIHNKCATYYIEKKMNLDNIISKGFSKIDPPCCNNYPISQELGLKHYGSDHMPVSVELVINNKNK